MRTARIVTIAAPFLVAGCMAYAPPAAQAPVSLIGSAGQVLGTVRTVETSGGVTFRIDARGLPMGIHGIHVHPVGRCDPPDFSTAGTHWNPQNRKHGLNNPEGPHAGDMPNVTVARTGVLKESVTLAHATLAQLRDADGASVMIHAEADDYVSQPAGNSGAKIACAVIAPGG